jgi:tetratricopeptide (TPR) repeat protein
MTSPQKTPDPEFEAALACHQAGRLAEAEERYQAILGARPGHPNALHLIGVVKVQSGQAEAGIDWIARAIAVNPEIAVYHSNLGKALSDIGRYREAVASCHRALALHPASVDTFVNLGVAYNQLGQTEEAIASFRQALSLNPDQADARANLGAVLWKSGRLEEAEVEYSALLLKDPQSMRAYLGLGAIRHEQRRFGQAARLTREALRLFPNSIDGLSNLSITLLEMGRLDEAEVACRDALRLNPDFPAALSNLGLILTQRGLFAEGEANLRRAVELAPDAERNLANLASALVEQGRMQDAEECYRKIVRLFPQSADAKVNLSLVLLLTGRFEEGWRLYEHRRDVRALVQVYDRAGEGAARHWAGEVAPEQVLLIRGEQGFGDVIQFSRYLSMAAERVRIVVQAPAVLHRLLGSLSGIERLIEPTESSKADYYCSMLSLPSIFGTTPDSIPADIPYLSAPADAVTAWRGRLSARPGLKVGLAWAGSPTLRHDGRRSIDPALLMELLAIPGVSFVSLQKDRPFIWHADLLDWTPELEDFADTAALIEALDLVISVDTAVAHLAGALGKPVWLLNRFAPDWRWMLGSTDSPWYPSLRQFRQEKPDEWGDVLDQVAAELRQMGTAG